MKRARLSSLVSSLKTSLTLLQLANVIATGRRKSLMGAAQRRGVKSRCRRERGGKGGGTRVRKDGMTETREGEPGETER